MASVVSEITWLLGLFTELGVSIHMLVTIFSDSKSAIQLSTNLIFHERTKHIEIDCHFIRDRIKSGMVEIVHVPTRQQVAHLLTKGLSQAQHSYLLAKLGVLNVMHPPA